MLKFFKFLFSAGNASELKELKERNQVLSTSVELQSREIARLKKELNNLLEMNENEVRTQPPHIDFDGMCAVSVERMLSDDGLPVTVIGYRTAQDSPLSEWTIYCNIQVHQDLVKQFQTYTAKKHGR